MPLCLRYHARLRCLFYSSELMPLMMTPKEYKGWRLLSLSAMTLYRFDTDDLEKWDSVPMTFNISWMEVYRKGYRKIRENHAQKNDESCCQKNGRLFDSSKMEIKKMRCVIYTRVSTEDQTLENQISQLKEYAERQNWNIIDIVSDVASGGKSANERSGLKKVLAMAR